MKFYHNYCSNFDFIANIANMNGNDDKTENYFDSNNGLVPVWERVNQNFNTTGSYSYTLESGQYDTIGPESVFIDVDLPSSELGCTITDDCQVHLWTLVT